MKSRVRFLSAAALSTMMLLSSCNPHRDTVFGLRKIKISSSDLIKEAERLTPATIENRAKDRVEEALRNLVLRRLVLERPLDETEKEILDRLARWNRDRECVELGLKRELGKRWNIDDECRRAFDEAPQRFQLPESFRLQSIFLPKVQKNTRNLAKSLLRKLKADSTRFADFARKYSQSENASTGGITEAMPGSGVDANLRAAIGAHSDSREPFLAEGPRGLYLLRVLEFWPPPGGSYQQLQTRIQEIVSRRLMAQLYTEIRREIEKNRPVTIDTSLFLRPLVEPETICLRKDREEIRVADLQPQQDQAEAVAGPVLALLVGRYRNFQDACRYFKCSEITAQERTNFDIVALRMESFLENFAEAQMQEEIQRFFQIHQGAFRSSPQGRFDFWIFPFGNLSPLEARKTHEATLNRIIRGEKLEAEVLEEGGGSFLPDLELSQEQLRAWAPDITNRIINLEADGTPRILRSRRLGADLIVRLKSKIPARAMSLAQASDHALILREFIRQSREEVLDSVYQKALGEGRLSLGTLEACENALKSDS